MGYWVRFAADGTPDAYSGSWFEGSEWVENVPPKALETCRREPGGEWVLRDPAPVVPRTAEEIEAEREAVYQAAVSAREDAVDAAILASPAYRSFIRGDMTLTAYRDAASDIEAQFPMPER